MDDAIDRPETRFLDVEGGSIAYDDSGGDGRVILMIPGMGDLRAEYRFLVPPLRRAGYRVVTMDVRGFGATSAVWNDYSAHAVGRDALAVLAHLGAEDAVVLGNSFAAGSALWAAHDEPKRVAAVVLLGPIVRDHPLPPPLMLAFEVGFAGPWRTEFWLAYWNSLFPTRKPSDHAEYHALLGSNLGEPGRMDALLAMLSLSKADTAAMLPQTRVPALIVMGSLDPDFDDAGEEAKWLADRIGGERLMVDGAGHYPQAEAPNIVAAAITSFMQKTHQGQQA